MLPQRVLPAEHSTGSVSVSANGLVMIRGAVKAVVRLKGEMMCLHFYGALMFATAWCCQLVVSDAQTRPNIVFIMADDLGWADVAFHGGNAPTPCLDRLAKEGLELTQHYVAPVCSPTRTGLLTGRCWSRFGVTTPTNELALPTGTVTLPGALQDRGYDTCLVGKWHLGSLPKWGPNHFGFDHSYGSLAGGISPWNHRYKKGEYSVTWHRNEELIEESGHVTDLLTDEAVKWIRMRDSLPFFLYVPYTAVHLPIKEPDKWIRRAPQTITGNVARQYAACIMHLDDAVGRIISALEHAGARDNTLLVFTSDNGGSTAENNDLKYPDDNCPNGRLTANNLPLRGKKGDVYEGGTRVPTIVSWPARVKPGKVNNPVHVTDWMPTFCSLADFEPARDLKWDGVNLVPLLLHRVEMSKRPLYTAGPRWRASALRYGDWKLVVTGKDENRNVELFNIATDVNESKNLADTESHRVDAMLTRLQEAARRDNDALAR
ncbi:MAG: sulfatase-like hydrolase/transferase [Fuerstiella sp.]|nr:sulfatase-like hydrolase/transferase [Fuerstiella sp.]